MAQRGGSGPTAATTCGERAKDDDEPWPLDSLAKARADAAMYKSEMEAARADAKQVTRELHEVYTRIMSFKTDSDSLLSRVCLFT